MEDIFRNLPKFKPFALTILPLIDEWAQAYSVPPSEIIRQLPFAHGWINCNPKRAPRKDVIRFLNNWMRKAQQMGSLQMRRIQHPAPSLADSTHVDDMSFEEMQRIRQQNFPRKRASV